MYVSRVHQTGVCCKLTDVELTPEELQRIGQYTVNMAGIMCALGHDTPTSTTIYAEPNTDPMSRFVIDMFRATIIGGKGDPIVDDARRRIHEFVEEHHVLDLIGEAVTR